jgi:hypothetical protein
MAPGNEPYWWYFGQTGERIGQLLTQNKAMLTSLDAYVDIDDTVKFAVVMVPATKEWWWYYGVTAAQVGQFLTQNKAQLTDISAYIDTNNTLKFAVIMTPGTGTGWWYFGQTGEQVGQLLTQNKAMLTSINAYVDIDNTVKFAVAMVPATKEWWWYYGVTADQVGQFLTHNKAQLTDISAYIDTNNTLKFAVIMAPVTETWWWYFGAPAFIGQQLTQNKARLIGVSPYQLSTSSSITVDTYPNISGLNGTADLTIEQSGSYSFSGGWSPSNIFTGAISQDVTYSLAIRDKIRGKLFVFSVAGNVPVESSYNFNYKGTNASLAADWQFLSAGYTWRDNYSASLNIGATVTDIVNWYNSNKQTINEVVQVIAEVAAAVA